MESELIMKYRKAASHTPNWRGALWATKGIDQLCCPYQSPRYWLAESPPRCHHGALAVVETEGVRSSGALGAGVR